MTTKIYSENLSQPSRAVIAYCNLENIPVEVVNIRIDKLEHKTPEFKKISGTGKIPALSDELPDGTTFTMFESHAIIRYLADRYNKSTLYPRQNIQLKAIVDSYLDWHHTNTRKCAAYLFALYFAPTFKLKINIDEKQSLEEIRVALSFIQNFWLQKGKNQYIGNNQQLTVADICCYSEIAQMKFDEYDFENKFPVLHEWMKRMEQIPAIQKSHQVLFTLAPKIALKRKNALKAKL